jgi:glycosyltransferase involved in cell wall biosynthesis
MNPTENALITICIPHWQSKEFIVPCLRSIRKHSKAYDIEVIVIDNGSKDDSLDYLRTLSWIRLIERSEESPKNWPKNVFSAWNRGLSEASGQYYVTMHADVFIKSEAWLKPFLKEIQAAPNTIASGSGKLELRHPLYSWQKRVFGGALKRFKAMLPGKGPKIDPHAGKYPRDYCAMYDAAFLKKHKINFLNHKELSGGHQVAVQIWEKGGDIKVFAVEEMDRNLAHIAHGTTTLTKEIQLRRKSKQAKTHRKKNSLFREQWILDLIEDDSLDR